MRPNPQFPADLVTFTEEICNGKPHFLCSAISVPMTQSTRKAGMWLNFKTQLHKILDCQSRDMLNFAFLEKGLGLVSPSHFVYESSRKIFFMLYSINWSDFTIWLPLLIEILGNMCIVIICFPVDDVRS